MNKNGLKIPTLSLFSGAGGLDVGFHQAGFDIVGCVEIEEAYCKSLEANKKSGKYYSNTAKIHCTDIRKFSPEEYLGAGIECIIGGPPCQTFSAAGRRSGGVLGTKDERGKLFEAYCHILSVLKPKVFVFENVYGLPGANNGEPWKEIVNAFSELGYKLSADVLDAADYGVPQHRERLIIVGTLEGEFVFPQPTHGPDSKTGQPLVTVWDAISDLQDPNEKIHDIGGMYGHLLPLVPEGLNYSFFTREMGYPQPFFAWRSKFHDFLYKADRNAPSRTLKAQPGKFTGPFHWNCRHFSSVELKRIQSFPDDYEIVGTETKIIEQVGNSVPPKLANVLAISVKEQLLRSSSSLTYELREEGFKATFRKRQRERSEHYKKVALEEIAKRFPNINLFEPSRKKQTREFVISYSNMFEKQVTEGSFANSLGDSDYDVKATQDSNRLSIEILKQSIAKKGSMNVQIDIDGLSKYLINIDEVRVNASIQNHTDVFKVWDIIQEQLVSNSQFFTLIDIYGHYANRGDTVRVKTEFKGRKTDVFTKAISFFGSSENCGYFLERDKVSNALNIKTEEVDKIVLYLRELRFDLRTESTHPTIRTNEVICTYPFPLLSHRAQLERKIKA